MSDIDSEKIRTFGWEEWVSLPDLSLPAIRAKVDSGTKTSALHAVAIEPFGTDENPQVRFIIRPNPSDHTVEVVCSAKVIDRRKIISSNGISELRYIISVDISVDEQSWPIEVSLTNRETMSYRMLIGRSAIPEDFTLSPGASFLQPVLSFDAYKKSRKRKPIPRRPLRIGILTQAPNNYSNTRMIEAAEARGHVVDCIYTSRCYMVINSHKPEVHYDGKALPRYDAIIPRIGSSLTFYGMAVVRQFEAMGVYCQNKADSIGASRDKLLAHQILAQHGLGMPTTAFAKSSHDTEGILDLVGGAPVVVKLLESTQGKGVVLADSRKGASAIIDAFRGLNAHFLVQEFVKEAKGSDLRCFVVNGKVVGAMERTAAEGDFRSNVHQGGSVKKAKLTKEERRTAIKAAKILKLCVAGVDILRSNEGPKVLEVNSSPGLQGIEKATGKDIAASIIACIESNVHPVLRVSKR